VYKRQVVTFTQVTCPSDDANGLHAPGLRFGDKRAMALMSAVVGFGHLMAGFNNAQLTEIVATLIDAPTPVSYTHLDVYKRQAIFTRRSQ